MADSAFSSEKAPTWIAKTDIKCWLRLCSHWRWRTAASFYVGSIRSEVSLSRRFSTNDRSWKLEIPQSRRRKCRRCVRIMMVAAREAGYGFRCRIHWLTSTMFRRWHAGPHRTNPNHFRFSAWVRRQVVKGREKKATAGWQIGDGVAAYQTEEDLKTPWND